MFTHICITYIHINQKCIYIYISDGILHHFYARSYRGKLWDIRYTIKYIHIYMSKMNEQKKEILSELYTNPKYISAFSGKQKLYNATNQRSDNHGITKEDISVF